MGTNGTAWGNTRPFGPGRNRTTLPLRPTSMRVCLTTAALFLTAGQLSAQWPVYAEETAQVFRGHRMVNLNLDSESSSHAGWRAGSLRPVVSL